MAISRLTAPADPPTADTNWTQLINWVKLALLSLELPYRMDWANGLIKKGAIFHVSGTPYLNDTDVTPTGTASIYVKLTPSGDGSVLTASYVASLTGVTWNTTHNGWYDAGSPACLYIFDEHLAKANGVITDIRANRDVDFYRHTRLNIGSSNASTGTGSVSIGVSNTASNTESLAIGRSNTSSGISSTAIGRNNTASGGASVAYGYANDTSAAYSSVVGVSNDASGTYSSAFGYDNSASGDNSTAIGYKQVATRADSSAIGGMRKEIYLSTETENDVYDSLYSLLGSSSTVRECGAIGSFGIVAINAIVINGTTSIGLRDYGSTTAITLRNGNNTPIGSKIKIMFIDGIHT